MPILKRNKALFILISLLMPIKHSPEELTDITPVSAILETPLGVLLIQSKDEPTDHCYEENGEIKFYRSWERAIIGIMERIRESTNENLTNRCKSLLNIIEHGRFRVPGEIPKLKTEECQAALREKGHDKIPLYGSPEYIEFLRDYVAERVKMDLGLNVERLTVTPVLEKQNIGRNHLFCLARACGRIELDPAIHGIGFLDSPALLPLNEDTLSHATLGVFLDYVKSPQRQLYATNFMSDLSVSPGLVEQWYETTQKVYDLRIPAVRKKQPRPVYPVSSEHFKIE
jgi:hypothetical protein